MSHTFQLEAEVDANAVSASVTVGTNNDKSGYELADGAITAAKIATDAIDADALAADAIAEINATVDTALSDYDAPTKAELDSAVAPLATSSALGTVDSNVDAIKAKTDNLPALPAASGDIPTAGEVADAVWDEATTNHTAAGTFGEQVKTDVDAILADTDELQGDWTDGGRLDLLIDAIKAVTDAIPDGGALTDLLADVASILADTNELQSDDVPGLIAGLNNISAADILATALSESYAADGAAPTLTQAVLEILQWLTEKSTSGTSVTVKRRDGSTQATTYTLDDASAPTSITRS
jgi:hypothetical protein